MALRLVKPKTGDVEVRVHIRPLGLALSARVSEPFRRPTLAVYNVDNQHIKLRSGEDEGCFNVFLMVETNIYNGSVAAKTASVLKTPRRLTICQHIFKRLLSQSL